MKKELKHSVCLIALFLIGNMIISFPKGEGQKGSVWGFFICLLVSIFLCGFYSQLQALNSFEEDLLCFRGKKQILSVISGILFCLLCLFSFVVCCKEYVVLADKIRLKETPRFIIAAIFILLCLLLSISKKKVFQTFSLVSFFVVIISSVLMLFLSISSMKSSLFWGNFPVSVKDSFVQALTYFIHSFGQIIIVLYFIGRLKKAEAKKLQLWGIGTGSAVFFICLLQVLLLLGPFATQLLDFPYAAATGSITAAKSYSRLDGFTYYIYFICSLIKASVILATLIKLLKQAPPLLYKFVMAIFLLCAFFFSVITELHGVVTSDAFNLILLCIEITLPLVLYIRFKRS